MPGTAKLPSATTKMSSAAAAMLGPMSGRVMKRVTRQSVAPAAMAASSVAMPVVAMGPRRIRNAMGCKVRPSTQPTPAGLLRVMPIGLPRACNT